MVVFHPFIYLRLSNSELLEIWIAPRINSDPIICGRGLYMWGRWSATFKESTNGKSSLLTLLGATAPFETSASAKTCLSGSAERLSKLSSCLAAPCQTETIKHLLLTTLYCCKNLSARHRPAGFLNEEAAWSEPLTPCFQNHLSFNQPCQKRLALLGRYLTFGRCHPQFPHSPSLHLFHPRAHPFSYSESCSSIKRIRWMQAPDNTVGRKLLSHIQSPPRRTLYQILRKASFILLAEGFSNSWISPETSDPWFKSGPYKM